MIPKRRLVLAVIVGLPLLWLTVAVSIAGVLATTRPAEVLMVWPWSADAMATRSGDILADHPGPSDLAETQRLAVESMSRQPVNPVAAQALAFARIVADKSPGGVEQLMKFSEAMSRHVPQTQLWFIQTAVDQGKVDGALVHYDRALRTSPELYSQLGPILVAAANDPVMRSPLATMLERRPPWRYDFIGRLVTTSNNPKTLDYLVRAAGLSLVSPIDRNYLSAALARLIELKAPDDAFALDLRLGGIAPPAGQAVVNGNFAQDPLLPPFDWMLANGDDNGAAANREMDDAGGFHLRVSASAGAGGVAARQVVLLRPGSRYVLSVPVTGDGSGALTIRLNCPNGSILLTQAPHNGFVRGSVTVPQGCAAATLAIDMRGPLDGPSSEAFVHRVFLSRQKDR